MGGGRGGVASGSPPPHRNYMYHTDSEATARLTHFIDENDFWKKWTLQDDFTKYAKVTWSVDELMKQLAETTKVKTLVAGVAKEMKTLKDMHGSRPKK